MIESDADRLLFFSDWDSAEYTPNQYPHPSAKTTTITGIFDSEYVEVNGMESYSPIFRCRTSDASPVDHGARLTVNDVDYTVVNPQPDGTGLTILILELYDRP